MSFKFEWLGCKVWHILSNISCPGAAYLFWKFWESFDVFKILCWRISDCRRYQAPPMGALRYMITDTALHSNGSIKIKGISNKGILSIEMYMLIGGRLWIYACKDCQNYQQVLPNEMGCFPWIYGGCQLSTFPNVPYKLRPQINYTQEKNWNLLSPNLTFFIFNHMKNFPDSPSHDRQSEYGQAGKSQTPVPFLMSRNVFNLWLKVSMQKEESLRSSQLHDIRIPGI